MSLNLDINNYSIFELLDVIGINATDKQITKDILNTSIHNIVQDVSKSPNNGTRRPQAELDNLIAFLSSSYVKICSHFNIPFLKEDLLFISVNNKKNHQLVKHEDNTSYNTHSLQLKKGRINPILRQTYLQEMNINTLFRPSYNTNSSSDYHFTLPNPVKNVVSMKLSSFEQPESIYSISASNKNNEFTINYYEYNGTSKSAKASRTIVVPDGNYTGPQLVTQINDNPFNSILASYDVNNKKISFIMPSTTVANESFDLVFSLSSGVNRPYQLNLGWQMGFRQREYIYLVAGDPLPSSPTAFTGESSYNPCYTKYLLLHVDDYNNNHSIVVNTPFQQGVISSGEILGKIRYCNTNNMELTTNKRHYFGPVDIEKLHIRLYDEYGNVVNTNNGDYSFSIELECLYDL